MKGMLLVLAAFALLSLGAIAQAGPTLNPVAHYGIQPGGGSTWIDLTGNGHDASITGATWSGGALSFDGSGDYVNVGTRANLGLTDDVSFSVLQ